MSLTATERRQAKLLQRKAKAAERAKRVLRSLLTALDATTTYREPVTPRTPRFKKWRAVYGSHFELVADKGALLDADGKPTRLTISQVWSHKPGEIVVTNGQTRTGDPGRRYMVQPNHSLRAI